jgi:hypothetical protein
MQKCARCKTTPAMCVRSLRVSPNKIYYQSMRHKLLALRLFSLG